MPFGLPRRRQSLIKRILEAQIFGVEQISATTVAPKLAETDAVMSGLSARDWAAFRGAHMAVTQALKSNSKENWLPLIYNWEASPWDTSGPSDETLKRHSAFYQFFPCSARTIFDFGCLVYTNTKLNKFLLVEVYEQDPQEVRGAGHGHIHYIDLMRTLANKLFCILKYLGAPEPEWYAAFLWKK